MRRDIRTELHEGRLDSSHGTVSLPVEVGDTGKVAVRIVDVRSIESLKIISLGDTE